MGMTKKPGLVTDEMFNLSAAMINDPQESWWVARAAMYTLSLAKPELVAPHVDRLLYWMQHEDWWFRNTAMTALTPVVADKRYYKKILTQIGKELATGKRGKATDPVKRGILAKLQAADPEVERDLEGLVGRGRRIVAGMKQEGVGDVGQRRDGRDPEP